MQRKLSFWAEEDRERRFDDLFNLVCRPEWLRAAHDKVKANGGSVTAGCDGVNMARFGEDVEGNLDKIRDQLKAKTFDPYPVRRVHIPKNNGKLRPLGIPTVRDRIVQEALRSLLEPIFEADFSQSSYGFRPDRRTMDAIRATLHYANDRLKYFWVVEGDISSYFDTVKHKRLMKLLERRVKDKKVLDLVWKFLKAGVMENKLFKPTDTGVPQGGIISPLLANVYLHELDMYMWDNYTGLPQKEKTKRRKSGLSNYAYVRYADDWLVLCNGTKEEAYAMREELQTFLAEHLRLDLSLEKTKVTHLNDGFEFLGFKVQRRMGSKGMGTKILIPAETVKRVQSKIALITSKSSHNDSVHTTIQALNRVIRGWCNYYKYTSRASTDFNKLEYYTYWRMAHWLARKYKLTMPTTLQRFSKNGSLGAENIRLVKANEIKSATYTGRFIKPNPFTSLSNLEREKLIESEEWAMWTGKEERPGQADAKTLVLIRDGATCRKCGDKVTRDTSHLDHKTPRHRFKDPREADVMSNYQILCVPCHKEKTKHD